MKLRGFSNRHRAGFTLIELLVSVSASALLLSINAVWIYQTMRYSSRVAQRHHDHQKLARLADEFRDEVRSCHAVEVVNESEIKLVWRASESDSDFSPSASYKIDGSQFLLTKQISQFQVRRERYALADNTVIGWDVSAMPEMIGLLISRDPAKDVHRKYHAHEQADSVDALSVRPTPPEQLVPLMSVRVGPNRWPKTVTQLSPNSNSKAESAPAEEVESEIKVEPSAEPEPENQESEVSASE